MMNLITSSYAALNDCVISIDGFTFSLWSVFLFAFVVSIISSFLWGMFR